MMKEQVVAKGVITARLYGVDGALKQEQVVDNIIVATGKSWMASRWKDATAAAMSHIGVGTNAAAAVVGDTTLGTEVGRAALTTTTVAANKITYAATFGPGVATGALVESGVFNAASAGTMLNRGVFAVINKGAADTLVVTWEITQN